MSDIKFYDNQSSSFLPYGIYVSLGTISGYSLKKRKRIDVNVYDIIVSYFQKEFIGESDYSRIVSTLNEEK